MTEPSEAPAAAERSGPGAHTDPPGRPDLRQPSRGSAAVARAWEALPRSVNGRAALAGTVVSALLVLAIVFGSRMLHNFDSALLPYAVASVFLAFGVAYRYTVWVSAPGARRLFVNGWRSFFSADNFRQAPTALPRMIATYLGFQKFLGARSHARWAPIN